MTQSPSTNRTPSAATSGTGSRGAARPAPQSSPNITLILIALGLGLITIIVTNWYIHQIRTQVESQKITLYQLKRPMDPGDSLNVGRDLRPVQFPAPPEVRSHYIDNLGALTPEEAENYNNQPLRRAANTNALLTADLFTPYRTGGSSELPLRDGYRGVTIEIDRNSAPPFLRPEMYVDLYGTLAIRGKGQSVSLIMEKVRVLAVGAETSPTGTAGSRRGYSEITIELRPDEVKAIKTLAENLVDDDFTIALRNRTDDVLEIPTGSINPELAKAFNLQLEQPE